MEEKEEIIGIWPLNEFEKLQIEEAEPEKRYRSHHIYFHGALNSDIGDDRTEFLFDIDPSHIVKVPNFSSVMEGEIDEIWDETELFREEVYLEGGYRVKVAGIDKPCIGIFYTRWDRYKVSQSIRSSHLAINPCPRCPEGISKFQPDYNIPKIHGLIVYEDNIEDLKSAILEYRWL